MYRAATHSFNPALFIADAACESLTQDVIGYRRDCLERHGHDGGRVYYLAHCARHLTFVGLLSGPFCGLNV